MTRVNVIPYEGDAYTLEVNGDHVGTMTPGSNGGHELREALKSALESEDFARLLGRKIAEERAR